jgi:hypothetical protein
MAEFRCRNIGLSAFMAAIGLIHLRTEKVGATSTVFVFDDPLNQCAKIERDFYSGAGCDDVQRVTDSYRTMTFTVRTARSKGIWKNEQL